MPDGSDLKKPLEAARKAAYQYPDAVRARLEATLSADAMRLVRDRYRGWHVALLLDEDPCHTAQASRRAAAGMTLLWLPKRAPKLNPIETLWGQEKDITSADVQYPSIEEHVLSFLGQLRSMSNRQALHTAGILSPKFWLRRALSN